MLNELVYALVLGGVALALSAGLLIGFTLYDKKLKREGGLSGDRGFASKALDIVFKFAVGAMFAAGVYIIAEGVWRFMSFPG